MCHWQYEDWCSVSLCNGTGWTASQSGHNWATRLAQGPPRQSAAISWCPLRFCAIFASTHCALPGCAAAMAAAAVHGGAWEDAGLGKSTCAHFSGDSNLAERSGRFQSIPLALVYLHTLPAAQHALHCLHRPRLHSSATLPIPFSPPVVAATNHGQRNVSRPSPARIDRSN